MTLEQFYNIKLTLDDINYAVKKRAVKSMYVVDTMKVCNDILNLINNKKEILKTYKNIEQLINSLDSESKNLIALRYESGMTVDKISKELKKPVRSLLRKYKKIAEILMKGGVEINGRRTTTKTN